MLSVNTKFLTMILTLSPGHFLLDNMFWIDKFKQVLFCGAGAQEEIAEIHLIVEASKLAVALTQGAGRHRNDGGFDADPLEDGNLC